MSDERRPERSGVIRLGARDEREASEGRAAPEALETMSDERRPERSGETRLGARDEREASEGRAAPDWWGRIRLTSARAERCNTVQLSDSVAAGET